MITYEWAMGRLFVPFQFYCIHEFLTFLLLALCIFGFYGFTLMGHSHSAFCCVYCESTDYRKPSIASTSSYKFGGEWMIKAQRGLLEQQSLEDSGIIVVKGENLTGPLNSSMYYL